MADSTPTLHILETYNVKAVQSPAQRWHRFLPGQRSGKNQSNKTFLTKECLLLGIWYLLVGINCEKMVFQCWNLSGRLMWRESEEVIYFSYGPEEESRHECASCKIWKSNKDKGRPGCADATCQLLPLESCFDLHVIIYWALQAWNVEHWYPMCCQQPVWCSTSQSGERVIVITKTFLPASSSQMQFSGPA